MTAQIIDGKQLAAQVRAEIADGVAALVDSGGARPGLATVLVGDDPASHVYVSSKEKLCGEVGIDSHSYRYPADVTIDELKAGVQEAVDRDDVHGILVQLPLPDHIDTYEVLNLIPLDKDVDGILPASAGSRLLGLEAYGSCTPTGIIRMLDHAEVPIEGAHAVIIGRSNIVGKPMATLLLERNATVTIAHSRTRDLDAIAKTADILIAAVGVPRLVNAGMVKRGAAVIDVGINRTDIGLVGDVDFDGVLDRAGWITPVPGGVGPMTIAMLLSHTLEAARRSAVSASV